MAENNLPGMGQRNIGALTNLNESPDITPDAKTKALRRTMLIKSLNTGRCTSAQELSERFEQLFDMCFRNNFIPTVEALALCSGINRRDIWEIENGHSHKGDGMRDIIKEAKEFIATLEAELARDGEINSTVYIFRAKNYYGMTDKQEVVVTPNVDNKVPDNVDDIIKAIPKLDEGSQDK